MSSSDDIFLAGDYDITAINKHNSQFPFVNTNENELEEKASNNPVYSHLRASDCGNIYTDGDNKDDAILMSLDVEQFCDINNLPPSLSVAITNPENLLNEANIGIEVRKTIMVGNDYQAIIPDLIGFRNTTNELPYNGDKLLWSPYALSDDEVDDYLVKAHQIDVSRATEVATISRRSHTRDDEQALYTLLQNDFKIEQALEKLQSETMLDNNLPPLWTEEECRNFESGIRIFGKNFLYIQLYKVKNRTIGDLVQFYYLWKKTERFNSCANKVKIDKRRSSVSSSSSSITYDQRENVPPLNDLQFTDIHNSMYEDTQMKHNNEAVVENLFVQKLDKKNSVFEDVDDSVFDMYNQQVSTEGQSYTDSSL